VIVDATHDRVTTFDYDGAGRLTASTDAIGTVTTITYDGLSRVIMTQTGDRVTRYLYDKDNRRVGIVDALGYFTEYKYDAGGRLVETVRYNQRSPAAANISAPVWIDATQQTVVPGRPFRYRLAAYDADGDPLVFSVVGALPAWVSFDADTAHTAWEPAHYRDQRQHHAARRRWPRRRLGCGDTFHCHSSPSSRWAGSRGTGLGTAISSGHHRKRTGELRRARSCRLIAHLQGGGRVAGWVVVRSHDTFAHWKLQRSRFLQHPPASDGSRRTLDG
jgi:YD repeat-containing protein